MKLELYKKCQLCDYYVSECGRVFSSRNGMLRQLSPRTHKGYLSVKIGGKSIFVHRIVASVYLLRFDGDNVINHIDGNKQNNNYTNLEWCTQYENNNHAFKLGLNNSKKMTDAQVLEIVKKYNSGAFSSRELSEQYGVSDRIIMKYVRGHVRKHLGIKDTGYRSKPGPKTK